MGLAITNTSNLLDAGTALTNWSLIGDTGTVTTVIFPPGATGSLSAKYSNEIGVSQYDDGATGSFAAGDHFGMWYSFLFGTLATRAAGGVTFRVSGATQTDFAEVYVGGSDDGKSGWQYVVVSLDRILSNPDNVGGTPPTTAASIQFAGVSFNVTATVAGNNDNVAWQAISHFPAATPGLRLEGTAATAAGALFNWDDVATAVEASAQRGFVLKDAQGVFILNCPLEIGDTTVSSVDTNLEDTGVVLAWAGNEYVDDDFYGITVSANATDDIQINAGTKLGTGETATGVGGWTIITGGPRWFIDAEAALQTAVNMYGCAFSGSGPWSIDANTVEMISCVFSNCDTIAMTGGTNGPTLLSNFFSAAPGPQAQIVFTSGVTPDNGQFDFNGFANMKWFAIEIPAETAAFDLRGVTFSGNGTNRDVLLSHITDTPQGVELNVLENGDTPGVTNGATITVTMVGTCDVLMVTAGTWSNAVGTETNDLGSATGTLVTQTTASLSVNDDTFAISAAVPGFKPDPGVGDSSITYSGVSDQYEDSNPGGDFSEGGGVFALQGADEVSFAAATRTGFPVHTEAETEAVQGLIHVDSDADAIPVVNLDALTAGSLPEMRPWSVARNTNTITFSYGAGNGDSGKGTVDANRFIYVSVVALGGVAADTAVSTMVLNRVLGTTTFSSRATSFPQQDDNVGTTGRSLELGVWDYDVDTLTEDLDQGEYNVNNNVTVTVTGVTEGATVTMEATGGGDLADGTVIGTAFPLQADANGEATDSHSYTNPQDVNIRARYSGLPIAAIQEDNLGAVFTDFTAEANDSTAGNVILMPAGELVNDAFYFGFLQEIDKLVVTLDTVRAGTWSLTWEYWNGAWVSLTNVVDGTSDFGASGNVTFTKPGDSVAVNRSAQGSPTTTPLHFVRARISSFTSAGAGPTATKTSGNPTKYLPFVGSATIEATGLTVPAVWVVDSIAR